MSSLKKFDYRIKDNRKRNIFLCGIVLVVVTIVGIKLYQSKAQFTSTTNEMNLASGNVRLTCTNKVKPNYNQELTEFVNDLYKSGECPELVDDETEDNNIRYIGATPDNYVLFNDELWRIIGVMNNIDDGTGKKESRIKLIRNESLGDFFWDYKQKGVGSSVDERGSNDWSDSQLMMMLNPVEIVEDGWKVANKDYHIDGDGYVLDNNQVKIYKGVGSYYNHTSGYKPALTTLENFPLNEVNFSDNGLKDESKKYIGNAKWHLGGAIRSEHTTATAATYYTKERGTKVYSNEVTRPSEWTGFIGVIYASDSGFATSGGTTTDRKTCLEKGLYEWSDSNYKDCYKNNWLYDLQISEWSQWLINPRADTNFEVAFMYHTGYIHFDGDVNVILRQVRPSLFLKSDVKITSGNGSKQNPFKLTL